MIRNIAHLLAPNSRSLSICNTARLLTNLTQKQITQILSNNEVHIDRQLPSPIKYIECNQLGSNSPIEDRIRVSSLNLPGHQEPTLIAGVFDGHGGGITADIISRRLFHYIAIALHPHIDNLKPYDIDQMRRRVIDLYASPPPERSDFFQSIETNELLNFKQNLSDNTNIEKSLMKAFKQCDDDLSDEIEQNLLNPKFHRNILHYYLTAAVSGCCAIVAVVHDKICYIASSGDCRGVLGEFLASRAKSDTKEATQMKDKSTSYISRNFRFEDLNKEHNCDNIDELRRLAGSHPKSEQNTMIRHNRLLGNLMPFRAFGDFNYKWTADKMKDCGLIKAFGPNVAPTNYKTPPYLIADPDVKQFNTEPDSASDIDQRCVVIASDGLWEMFENSRDVIQSINDHSELVSGDKFVDKNCATHLMRAALQSGPQFDHKSMDAEELQKKYHLHLQSILTLPQSIVRNFRDDISLVVLRL